VFRSFIVGLIAAVAVVTAAANPASARAVALNLQTPVAYIDINALKGKIPDRQLLEILDDDQDGVIDPAVWSQIQDDVQTEIDGILGQRYATPFTDPLPAVVKLAAQTLAVEGVFNHRNLLSEKSPERINANALRKKLSAIADGEEPLSPGKERARPSASVITEPSRTSSDRPAI
jgi:phage gp36-like protein